MCFEGCTHYAITGGQNRTLLFSRDLLWFSLLLLFITFFQVSLKYAKYTFHSQFWVERGADNWVTGVYRSGCSFWRTVLLLLRLFSCVAVMILRILLTERNNPLILLHGGVSTVISLREPCLHFFFVTFRQHSVFITACLPCIWASQSLFFEFMFWLAKTTTG